MADQLPENPNQQPRESHDADFHLDNLLPKSLETSWWAGFIGGIKDLVNPPKLPPLEVTSKPVVIKTIDPYAGSEWKAGLMSVLINGGILGLLIIVGTNKVVQEAIKEKVVLIAPNLAVRKPPPLPPQQQTSGGGGGGMDKTPETKGKLPRVTREFKMPVVQPKDNPKLAMDASIVAPNLPNVDMGNFGDPSGMLGAPSTGIGGGGGIGPGKGSGVGPGEGGGFGGGAYRIGGGVSAPIATYKPEPEYSEEARKAKYQGEVWLSVVVDEKGVPQQIKVTRKLGLGLDEKAIEAVSKWRFKPGLKDGKPVAVQATIAVSFHLL